ncbi:nucleoside hydrolase [Clavulina sp. PMI_390]|nr:nucleoside hydrolase [Clavulina sp. PMI_390]
MVHKIIIDTDPGVDDTLAILLLLASPEISIELISVTFGNTVVDRAFLNVLKVYNVARKHLAQTLQSATSRSVFPNLTKDTPTILAKGAARPIEGSLDLAEYFHGFDGLSEISRTRPDFSGDVDQPDKALTITQMPGHEAVLQLLAKEPAGSVTILALGPLTTVALAYQQDPETFRKVARVVSMGGALDVPGNTSATAEFNFFADPHGAKIVMGGATKGEFRMVVLPLDITQQHSIHFNKLIRTSSSPNANNAANGTSEPVLYDFLTAILSRPRKALRAWGLLTDTFDMHDPLAAYYVIDTAANRGLTTNEGGKERWKLTKRKFLMERTGEWTKGTCVVDRRQTEEVDGAVRSRDGITHDASKEGQGGAVPAKAEGEATATEYIIPELAHPHTLEVSIVTASPGVETFEKLFLARVYGDV